MVKDKKLCLRINGEHKAKIESLGLSPQKILNDWIKKNLGPKTKGKK